MITTLGKPIILKALTTSGETFAASMGFGISDAAPVPGDLSLDFEIVQSPVDVVDYDEGTSRILVRSVVPYGVLLNVHEVGISTQDERSDENFVSGMVTFFDDDEESWSGYDALETSGVRSGNAAFRLNMGGGTGLISSSHPPILFEDMLATSTLALAYQRLGGAATATFRAHVDASNYRAYSFSLGAGFGVERWTRSEFTETGSAPWADISYVEIGFSGDGPILLEGLRQDEYSVDSDILVARYVLGAPLPVLGSSEVQFEYSLPVVFS